MATSNRAAKPAAAGASQHYAWNSSTAQRSAELAAAGVDTSPKPVDASATSPKVVSGGSAWNAAGTWEEKDATAKLTPRLRELLLLAATTLPEGGAFRVTSVSRLDGTVTQVFARGRPRLAYELEVAVDFDVVGAGAGTVHLREVCDTTADCFDELIATGAEAAAVGKRGGAVEALMRSTIRSWAAAALAPPSA